MDCFWLLWVILLWMWVYKCLGLISILFGIYQEMNRRKAATGRKVRFLLCIFYIGEVVKHPSGMSRRLLGIQAQAQGRGEAWDGVLGVIKSYRCYSETLTGWNHLVREYREKTVPGTEPRVGSAKGEQPAKGPENLCEEDWKSPAESFSRRREHQPCWIIGVSIGSDHMHVINNLDRRT